jgi:two-component system cell cycle response regulator
MRSVRSRLVVVLVPALLLPLLLAMLAIGVLGPRQQRTAAALLSQQTATAMASDLEEQCRSLGETARYLAAQAGATTEFRGIADAAVPARQPDAFAVVLREGSEVDTTGSRPVTDKNTLVTLSCSSRRIPAGTAGAPVLGESVNYTQSEGASGTVVVGRLISQAALTSRTGQLSPTLGQQVALACRSGAAVSTVDGKPEAAALRRAATDVGSTPAAGLQVRSVGVESGALCNVAVGTPVAGATGRAGRLLGPEGALPAGLLALLVLLVGGLLVMRLAASLTDPVLRLTEAAERVARGDLTRRLPADSQDELGRLSAAFNHMTEELQVKIGELERSRDRLRQNVARLGDTLQRTHDLDGLLTTVLQAALSATEAQRATAWLVEGESVVARVSSPPGAPRAAVRRLPVGSDIAGEVAKDGRARRLGHGHEDASTLLGGPTLAAPLRRGNGVLGVLVVEREPAEPAFTSDDEAMLTSLAGPAGIAVDNVLLHREAQRLSVTDPLTGAGNLRHMTTTLAREVERSTRFDRPLSVLLLDLDHFKGVNDTYGHTVGDGVLRELARRLSSVVREVDTVARYGGEEFVVVTPETDTAGAQRLAQRICETVREEPFRIGSEVVEVTVSVGVASLPVHGTASGDLVRAADEGLYAAKRAGRDQWQVAPGGQTRVGR